MKALGLNQEKNHLKTAIDNLGGVLKNGKATGSATLDYVSCGSFSGHIEKFATSLANNRAWKKIAAPMTIALVVVTLLAQPLFGNIKKEFPEEGKNGGAR